MSGTRQKIAKGIGFARENADKIRYLPAALLNFRVDIVMIHGKIRGQDNAVVLLYVGRGRNLAYFKKSFLIDAEIIVRKKSSLISFRADMKPFEEKCDLSFLDIGWPYDRRLNNDDEYLRLPDWISMVVPIEKDWESIEKKFNKTTRKQIRRMEYQFEATNDPSVVNRFYDDFYVPFVSHRHDGDVILDSRKDVERRARQGKVLLVSNGEGPVAGGIIFFEGDVLYFLWVGMPKKYVLEPPSDAILAVYYFCLRYAFENSYKFANWMGTRALPTDGVFQFKRRWGAHVSDSFSPNSILIKPTRGSKMAAKFLENFPLLSRKNGKIRQIFCSTSETCGETEIKRMLSSYACGGIDEIKVVHLVNDGPETEDTVSVDDVDVIVQTAKVENFWRLFK